MSEVVKEIDETVEEIETFETEHNDENSLETEPVSEETTEAVYGDNEASEAEPNDDDVDVDVDENTNIEEAAVATAVVASTTGKVDKHTEAKKIIHEAKTIVHESAKEVDECKLLLENDLRDYNDAKRALKEGGLEDAKSLLVELGHATMEELDNLEEPEIEIEDDVEPIEIKDVSSGKFTGFILSLLAGAATFGGLVYLATEKLGMTLDVSKVPTDDTINKISNWYANLVNMGDNAQVGMGIITLITLLVMFIVYKMRVALKSGSNLRFANKQMEETQKFVEQKQNCKEKMEQIDAHIHDSIATLNDYKVLLNEQNGKLNRIMHFERKDAETHGYSHSSIEEMNETQNLIASVQDFISEPILSEGNLAQEAIEALGEAKERIVHFLKRFA